MTRLDLLLTRPDVTCRGLHIMPLEPVRAQALGVDDAPYGRGVRLIELLVAARRVREPCTHARDLTPEPRTPCQ